MTKQTAVEWLIEELNYNGFSHLDLATDIIEQAKEMEKENMISFYLKGCDDTYGIDEPVKGYDRKQAEEYYNQTFKNS